jgi:starch-binding outer membrane protein, SusD/RagB family
MYKLVIKITLALFGAALFVSCDGFLDTRPTTSVDPISAQENVQGIEAILTSAYHRYRAEARYGRVITLTPDILADNTEQHPVTSGRGDGQSVNQQGSHMAFWNTAYLTINETNYVIDGASETDAPQSTRDRLQGEALFLRGFTYFDLARTYGYEPGREVGGWTQSAIIRTNPTRDLDDADYRPRSSNVDVYNQAVSDLEDAAALLSNSDRGVFFANYAAAHALLARMHLYLENWEEAIDHADIALSSTSVQLLDTEADFISNPFNSVPNPESIFELNIDPIDEGLGSNVGLCPWTQPQHWFDVVLSQDLVSVFDPNDYRNHLYDQLTDNNGTWDYTLKWNCSTGAFDDNVPVIRLPELFLIKAEAHAELDQLPEALANLEELQTTRGLTPFVSADKDEIIDEIMTERRRELHFEGHRFFDLKRRAMDITKQAGATTLPYTDFKILAPLTQGEVDSNPLLDNNPGY